MNTSIWNFADEVTANGVSLKAGECHCDLAHADRIIDLGPGGHDGGRIVFAGAPADLVAARSTLTGNHLEAYVGT